MQYTIFECILIVMYITTLMHKHKYENLHCVLFALLLIMYVRRTELRIMHNFPCAQISIIFQ